MEYLKIAKKTNYNSEKREIHGTDDETKNNDEEDPEKNSDLNRNEGFDIERLNYEQKEIELFNDELTMYYNSKMDQEIVDDYISYLIINNLKKCRFM